MKYFLLSFFIFLTGCIGLNEPLTFEDKTQPVYIEHNTLSAADYDQIKAVLSAKGVRLTDIHDFNSYKLTINSLRHQSRDLYDDPSSYNLYLTVTSFVDATLYDRQKEEILWNHEFKNQQSFKPSVHFYSDQQWARAELIWNQQLNLFNQLADQILETCKKEPILSGS
jgi:hypothetical protein